MTAKQTVPPWKPPFDHWAMEKLLSAADWQVAQE